MKEIIIRQLKKGIIQGYIWPLDDPKREVCIIHGIGEYGGRYERVASKFNKAGYAAFSMDLRGHGKSIGRKGDCAPREEVLEDISALISLASREYPHKDIILYGHSMGGNITLDYRRRGAFRDYVKAYLISAPWIRLVRPIPKNLYRITKAASKMMPKMTFGASIDETKLGNPLSVMPYHDDPMIHNRISLRCAVDCFDKGLEFEDRDFREYPDNGSGQGDIVSNIPLMLMQGTEDQICDIEGTEKVYEKYRELGENVEFIRLPGIFHEIHNGGIESTGDEVIDKMIEFFDKC